MQSGLFWVPLSSSAGDQLSSERYGSGNFPFWLHPMSDWLLTGDNDAVLPVKAGMLKKRGWSDWTCPSPDMTMLVPQTGLPLLLLLRKISRLAAVPKCWEHLSINLIHFSINSHHRLLTVLRGQEFNPSSSELGNAEITEMQNIWNNRSRTTAIGSKRMWHLCS